MHPIDISANKLVSALLEMSKTETVCLLDSCGVGHLGSHLLIAGIQPVEIHEITNEDPAKTMSVLNEKLTGDQAAIFTLSYVLGTKLDGIMSRHFSNAEPDVSIALFDDLIIHDYNTGSTFIKGHEKNFGHIVERLGSVRSEGVSRKTERSRFSSNFSKDDYICAVEVIKEHIRCGNTYQTNLTQQISVELATGSTPQRIFWNLRRDHPAPFASFITRTDSVVVSASPERFFRVEGDRITTSPIKGTRPRGRTKEEDDYLRKELLGSEKDIAENTMIVDLLRNDLGRVCQFGSVSVEKLCDLEEHPTLFHLVSTISGKLRKDITTADIIKALFPCGSITGAPKISTMRMIDEIEPSTRGLSMGAIGIYIPDKDQNSTFDIRHSKLDLSVAIRTMTIRDSTAVFNVGGGIVIDSDPEKEYDESLLKAQALLEAIGC